MPRKPPERSFLEWTDRFSTQQACLEETARHPWPEGLLCPCCGHDQAYLLNTRAHKRQCARCRYQVPATAGTIFHRTHVPLPQWFAAISLMGADKGGVSAPRLSKRIGVSWSTACPMLRMLRRAMGDRNRSFGLCRLFEVDDALVGGRRAGKRGPGAGGKMPVLLAVENRGHKAGHLAAGIRDEGRNGKLVRPFAHHPLAGETERKSDTLAALASLGERRYHTPRVTPPEPATKRLPKVHLVIATLKRLLLGTFHGVRPRYLQDDLDAFVDRCNRPHWETALPQRLLEAAVAHVPIQLRLRKV